MPITRREFCRDVLFGVAAALSACRPRPPGSTLFPTATFASQETPSNESLNAKLIQDLRALTGITPDTTQDQLAQLAYDKTFRNLDWYFDPLPSGKPLVTPMTQSHFTDFTVNGEKIGVCLNKDDGELSFFITTDPREFRPVTYPELLPGQNYSNAVFLVTT